MKLSNFLLVVWLVIWVARLRSLWILLLVLRLLWLIRISELLIRIKLLRLLVRHLRLLRLAYILLRISLLVEVLWLDELRILKWLWLLLLRVVRDISIERSISVHVLISIRRNLLPLLLVLLSLWLLIKLSRALGKVLNSLAKTLVIIKTWVKGLMHIVTRLRLLMP
jgi:hypothetical protein